MHKTHVNQAIKNSVLKYMDMGVIDLYNQIT